MSTKAEKSQPPPSGTIITFYSYKGGTGRTMALANMAWVLASNGKRVLVVDWDLEAPGLHRFLHPFLEDKSLSSSEGVIDFVVDYTAEAMTPKKGKEPLPDDWYKPHANILRYATSINWKFQKPGTLDLVSAGKQGPSYASRVNGFNWQRFYEEFGGYKFMEAVKERMKAEYDYILLDSRTGVSDTSGICTVQMPDILVVCFTLNNQSIEGAWAVAEAVDAQRRDASDKPGVRIFPVPTRVEMGEKDRLNLARNVAKQKFSSLLWHLEQGSRESYWGEVEILYEPYYAYEEILATFAEQRSQTTSLLASIERLSAHVTRGDVKKLVSSPEADRQRVLKEYVRQQPESPQVVVTSSTGRYWFYFSYARGDFNPYMQTFFRDLETEVRHLVGSSKDEPVGFVDVLDNELGSDWSEETQQALQNSRTFVALYSPMYFNSVYCGKEFAYFLARRDAISQADKDSLLDTPQILPVLWNPLRKPLPKAAASIQYLDDSADESYRHEGLRYLIRLKRGRDDYIDFCYRFAESVVRAAERVSSIGAPDVPPFTQLESAFHPADESEMESKSAVQPEGKTGPSVAKFVFVVAKAQQLADIRRDLNSYGTAGGWDWRPFLPATQKSIGIIAQTVAVEENLISDEILVSSTLIKDLRNAEGTNSIVILIVDAWTLNLPAYSDLMTLFDSNVFWNCGVLAPLNTNDQETSQNISTLEATLTRKFRRWSLFGPNRFWFGPADGFEEALRRTLIRVRAEIVEVAVKRGADNAPLIVKPNILGPGGGST